VDQAGWIKLLRKPWALVRWRRVLDTAVARRTTRALTDLRKKAKQVVATSHHACRNRLGPLSALITACTPTGQDWTGEVSRANFLGTTMASDGPGVAAGEPVTAGRVGATRSAGGLRERARQLLGTPETVGGSMMWWPGFRVHRPLDAVRLLGAVAALAGVFVAAVVRPGVVRWADRLPPIARSGPVRVVLSIANVAISAAVLTVLARSADRGVAVPAFRDDLRGSR